MTLNEFIEKYKGKGIDFDGHFGFQCVDLYRQYVQDVLQVPQSPGVTGAKDIWNSYLPQYFERIENTPDGVPKAGDIMIWGSSYGQYGHVAVITSATINSFTCFSQNDPPGTLVGIKKYTNWNPVLGWLHPKEKEVNNEQALKDKISDLETKVGTLNEAVASKSLEVNNLRTELEAEERDSSDLGNQLQEARSQREQFRAEAEMWEKKALNLENQLNSALNELNVSKEQIKGLEDTLKNAQALTLSKTPTSLVIKELIYRFWPRK